MSYAHERRTSIDLHGRASRSQSDLLPARAGNAPRPDYLRMYFQFRGLPSDSHSRVIARRRARVSACFASVIHSTYSRRWLEGKPSKAARAFLFDLSARIRSSGTTSGGLPTGFFRGGAFTPA